MKKFEKIEILQDLDMGLWLKTWQEEFDKLSAEQLMICVCGRLATGLHEQNCKKFNDKVQSNTVKRLWKP